jgi:hypothetical protein
MPNKVQPFRQHLVARGLRAAMAAGIPNPTVEFHSPDGGKIVVGAGGKPGETGSPSKAVKSYPKRGRR